MRLRTWLALTALGASGCAGPDPSSYAYLLLDTQARAAGIEVGGARAPVLPIVIDTAESDTIELGGPRGGRLTVAPGELVWVRGAGGVRERLRIGGDVAEDTLLIRGDDDAARALAQLLDASLETTGDGELSIVGAELWSRVGDLEPPAPLREARPARAQLGFSSPAPGRPDLPSHARALAVGLYRSERGQLLLDASGGATLIGTDCGGELRGHYALDQRGNVLALGDTQPLRVTLADGSELRLVPDADGTLVNDRLGRIVPVEDAR